MGQRGTGFLNRVAGPFRQRMLPRFLIIGAQKAGTSALFKMLAQHPNVLAPEEKEQHFFDDDANYSRGITHYRAQFPQGSWLGGEVTFEATPSYLFVERAAERVHKHLPDARLIAVLRDPVARAYSAWNMMCDFRTDPKHAALFDARSFAQAVEEELSGKEVRWEHRYLARGYYTEQVQRYFQLFGRERLLVVGYGELKKDPAKVLARACAHAGLAEHTFSTAALRTRDNVRSYPEPLDPALAERLRAHFAPHERSLTALLGIEGILDESSAGPRTSPPSP